MNEDKGRINIRPPEKYTAQVGGAQGEQTYPDGRKRTQEDQDKVDDERRRIASRELVSAWMDRLQLISVITTFFASTEAVMVGVATSDVETQSKLETASNAAFLGALVLHMSAAITSFLAAFFLVNYRVHEAKKDEVQAEGHTFVETPLDIFEAVADPTLQQQRVFKSHHHMATHDKVDSPIWSTNPHLVQVGPFLGQPPTNILGRCHSLSVFLATVGFVLGVAGIGCFAWSRQSLSASIFTTICIGTTATLGVCILAVPDIKPDELGGGRFGRILQRRVVPV
ncbi:hypothetical protein AX14_014019 [Amanita brunnescens Koide BX004]|nr:hypothetical protein AX14_014019 [Amanita brunnescens Koide BX004]